MKEEKLKRIVREAYGRIAKSRSDSCCGGGECSIARMACYSEEELKHVPKDAGLILGCGNPVAIASLKKGETVLDLGSGAGLDCFLAAKKVGKRGKVIGVDMTPEMVERARESARKGGYKNVEFRLGEIENLPVSDSSVDVVLSNCVLNLVPNKRRAFEEIFRVLKPGGRLVLSDIVLTRELPNEIKNYNDAYAACIAGAITKKKYLGLVKKAGFKDVKVMDEEVLPADVMRAFGIASGSAVRISILGRKQ
ncbi:MAG: arsenite methyltransferase [Candidatus Micrarchaeia archaeon]